MKDKIAKKILEMEKDKLMSEPESDRDWELITALDIAIEALEEANNTTFKEVVAYECGQKSVESLQTDLANEVWKLYEKHHSHLATYVIEFGNELKELLCKYQKGDAG